MITKRKHKKKGTSTMNKEEMIKKVTELKELKAMAEELQGEITAIEDSIKAEMTAQNVNEIQAGIFKIRWTPVNSSRFDAKAFQAKYSELYEQFVKVVTTRRFSVGV